MESLLLLIVILLLAILIILLLSKKREPQSDMMRRLEEQLDLLRREQRELRDAYQPMREGVEKLSHLFLNTTRRGLHAESLLEDQLRSLLPRDAYRLKPRLENGRIPDAALIIGKRMVCIDAKAPRMTDGWLRMIRKHIDDVREKYVRQPDTANIAFLYLSTHDQYLMLIENEKGYDLVQEAAREGVILTSPLLLPLHVELVRQHAQLREAEAFAERMSREKEYLLSLLEKTVKRILQGLERTRQLENTLRDARDTLDEAKRRVEGIAGYDEE